MIKIINNLICRKQQEDLNKIVNSNHFPWYFLANVLQGRDKNFKQFNNITETYALVHTLFALPEGVNSDFFKYFKVVTDSFEKKETQRNILEEMPKISILPETWCSKFHLS